MCNTMSQGQPKKNERLPPSVEQQINENLKLLYEQRLQEELPDKLKDLVARLRDESNGGGRRR